MRADANLGRNEKSIVDIFSLFIIDFVTSEMRRRVIMGGQPGTPKKKTIDTRKVRGYLRLCDENNLGPFIVVRWINWQCEQ